MCRIKLEIDLSKQLEPFNSSLDDLAKPIAMENFFSFMGKIGTFEKSESSTLQEMQRDNV